MKDTLAYCNGAFHMLDDAGFSLTDLGVQRGYGIFDFLRVSATTPLFLEDHLDRFYFSANQMHLTISVSREEIRLLIYQLIHHNEFENSGIKIILTGGPSEDGYTIQQPSLSLIQQSIVAPPLLLPSNGIALSSYSFQRQLPEVKTTDYLMAIWLQPWLKKQGGQDILYHQNGLVTECPRSNIFMVNQNGVLVTPSNNILKGITRKKIISIAANNGITVEERNFSLEELNQAAEVFITSSTKRILPVESIDGKRLMALNANKPIANLLWNEFMKLEKLS